MHIKNMEVGVICFIKDLLRYICMEEEKANANSELRYIALELTKIAAQQKKPFGAVASEFVQNVYSLQTILKSNTLMPSSALKKNTAAGSGRQKKR